MITAAELGFYGIILVYLLMVLVMGMVLDSVSIMLITLPLILPALAVFNTDYYLVRDRDRCRGGDRPPDTAARADRLCGQGGTGPSQVKLGEIFAGSFPFVLI